MVIYVYLMYKLENYRLLQNTKIYAARKEVSYDTVIRKRIILFA